MNIIYNLIVILIIFNFYHKFIIKKKYNKKRKFKIINKKIKIKKLNPSKNITVFEIKNILNKPNHCLKFLLKNERSFNFDPSYYPGIRMEAPIKLKNELIELMLLINKKYYKIKGNIRESFFGFSKIDKPIDKLDLLNVFPHKDCVEFKNHKKSGLAIVIYLCNPNNNYGGTNIYEEKIPLFTKEFYKDKKYSKLLEKYNNLKNTKVSYDLDISDFVKLIFNFKVEFNKAVIYRTNYFHRADIKNKYVQNNNHLKNPRYTITGFICFDKKLKSNFYDSFNNDDDDNFENLNTWYNDGTENEILKSKYYL
jgi:hypothetical protein